jgi:hypothetical protein
MLVRLWTESNPVQLLILYFIKLCESTGETPLTPLDVLETYGHLSNTERLDDLMYDIRLMETRLKERSLPLPTFPYMNEPLR